MTTEQHVIADAVTVRTYVPAGGPEGSRPVGLYLSGAAEPDDDLGRLLAAHGDLVIVGVGHRTAAEHPAPLDDCDRALQWARCHAERLGGDQGRLAVIGTGAGGGLAAALARRARDRDEREIALQVLVDPAPGLSGLPEAAGLPAAIIAGVGPDPLCDDAVEYDRSLRAAGVPVVRRHLTPAELAGLIRAGLAGSTGSAPPAIDVTRRVEAGTRARLDRLARWDTASVESIRRTYRAVHPAPVPAHPGVLRSDGVIGGVRVRWYRPAVADGPRPGLVYFHGGAYIMGTLEENDDRLDLMVLELGCAVVSVDWRLAPVHPYPAGLDDAETVWRAVCADPAAYGLDGERLVVGGSSAGAGLAAALCLRLKDGPRPRLQLLVYPMLDDRTETASIRALEGGPGHWGLWHLRAQRLAWAAYLRALPGGDIPPTAAPARATVEDLRGLPPAFIGIGDADAYLDENLAYAARLSAAGVPTELHVYPGVIHGGFVARPGTPRTGQFLRDAYAALAAAFEPAP